MFRDINTPVFALRMLFLFVASTLAIVIYGQRQELAIQDGKEWMVISGIIGLAILVVVIDTFVRKKRIDTISSVYFGLIVGLFLTYVAGLVLSPFMEIPGATPALKANRLGAIQLVIGAILCYLCVSILLQTKDDFRFIIPYVEFAKEVKGAQPYLLDTSVIIDGRIIDVVGTGVLSHQIIVPRFVLSELQNIADSSDRMRRGRGRRGLDMLNKLRNMEGVDLQIYDRDHVELQGQPVDLKLVLLAKTLSGQVITNDYNLNKVAKLHDVTVLNLNDIANALKPLFLPGEQINVRAVKPGEEPHQAVGYLDDGTMVVIEGGRDHIGKEVHLSVTSVLQTSAGRMIFGKFEYEVGKSKEKSA
ncbi:MAG: PIN/TRAM domain-containing protein [Pirellulales bacterium]|nr:PIN/TRAM domain-containing protein [Pirellulales bacterium]